eukprot:c24803_g1_i4 orf=416-1735(-)
MATSPLAVLGNSSPDLPLQHPRAFNPQAHIASPPVCSPVQSPPFSQTNNQSVYFSPDASFAPQSFIWNDAASIPAASDGPFLVPHGTPSSRSQEPTSRRSLTRIVSMNRGGTPGNFGAEENVWKGDFMSTDIQRSSSLSPGRQRKVQPRNFFAFMDKVRIVVRSGNRPTRKLLLLIMLNVAYLTVEFSIGLFSGRVGLVSDAFHLTFGCGVLTLSLYAMVMSKSMHDNVYTYGYKRLEVLAAFTNALFLLFLSFSLAVEALHAFVQDESDHKHYLIVSAVTNLSVNLLGVLFFRNYARIRIAYMKAEDMNHHSICLHVLSDSIRRVKNAETLCLGLVSVAVFLVVMPLFKSSAGILLQMSPTSITASAFNKCLRQVTMLEDVMECFQARFWEMVPGYVVGTLLLKVKKSADEQKILKHVHCIYNDIGIKDLTVQIDIEH